MLATLSLPSSWSRCEKITGTAHYALQYTLQTYTGINFLPTKILRFVEIILMRHDLVGRTLPFPAE